MWSVYTFVTAALLVLLSHGVTPSSLTRTSVPSQVIRSESSSEYRLPTDVVPLSYDITLTPDLESENFTFHGKSIIDLYFRNTTQNIVLHFKDLDLIPGVSIACVPRFNSEMFRNERKDDTLTIVFPGEISIGSKCRLKMEYKGKDNGENRGFYRTSYRSDDGKKMYMASTQFEPISARQVFPCWDEPAIKAAFNISIKHNRKYIALSNMLPSTEVDPEDTSKMITHFGPSPQMSSYLVAFAVGDFAPVDSDDYKMQVWSRKNVIGNGRYALEVGPTILEALNKYTDYPYVKHEFPKMDSLIVPALSAGAMENWGLVIYKESELLYDEDSNSTLQQEKVASIMAHELAHQWFGNLVTAKWWNDIWLNEGFANYFEYFITHQIKPTWRMMDRFVVRNLQGTAFANDCKANSHAMVEERESNSKIMEGFDSITYSKSGSIIRMISNVLGETNFQAGLQKYLKTKAFGSATSNDLFAQLVEVGKNVSNLQDILVNWVNTPGYPVINVQRHYEHGNATITQSRFFDTKNVNANDKYWIPINFVTKNDLNFEKTEVSHWLEPSKNSLTIDILDNSVAQPEKESNFVILNKQQYGYYRVNYDENNWKMISDYLKTNHTKIHVLNRAQLIDDALNLAKVNKLNYTVALSLIEYLGGENDFIPWSTAWRGFEYISKIVANTDFASRFKKYVLRLSEHIVAEVLSVEFNGTDHIMQLKKVEALRSACAFGSNPCKSQATKILTKWLDNHTHDALMGDDERWVVCGGVRNAPQITWDKLWAKYLSEPSADILNALGCTSNIEILKGYIAKVKSAKKTQNLSAVFKAIYTGSDEGVDVVLDYMIDNYKTLRAQDGYGADQLKSDFTSLGGRLTNKRQLEKLNKFKKDADDSSKNLVDEALILVENNLKEYDATLNQFEIFFKEEEPAAPSVPDAANVFTLSSVVISVSLLITKIY